jgi:predicted Zn-dependent protease
LEVASIADQEMTAEELLVAHHSAEDLDDAQRLSEAAGKENAVTGFIQTENSRQRVAAIKLGSNVYYFSALKPENPDEETDALQLEIMSSFRRASNADLPPDREYQIYYKRLEPGETFLDLAKTSVLGRQAEAYLRLMNGYYPSGEAQPGTWMKLVK